jgi:hypothetical protein
MLRKEVEDNHDHDRNEDNGIEGRDQGLQGFPCLQGSREARESPSNRQSGAMQSWGLCSKNLGGHMFGLSSSIGKTKDSSKGSMFASGMDGSMTEALRGFG